MELKDLVGEHELKGVGEITVKNENSYTRQNGFTFKLDDTVYTAIENIPDGYRSYMSKLRVDEDEIDTKIPPIKVTARMKPDGDWTNKKILELIDQKTGETVLEVGTDNYDDYYPCYVFDWRPENLSVNQQ